VRLHGDDAAVLGVYLGAAPASQGTNLAAWAAQPAPGQVGLDGGAIVCDDKDDVPLCGALGALSLHPRKDSARGSLLCAGPRHDSAVRPFVVPVVRSRPATHHQPRCR